MIFLNLEGPYFLHILHASYVCFIFFLIPGNVTLPLATLIIASDAWLDSCKVSRTSFSLDGEMTTAYVSNTAILICFPPSSTTSLAKTSLSVNLQDCISFGE